VFEADRGSDSVPIYTRLLEIGVEIRCRDIPDADCLTLHILAAIAELECRMFCLRPESPQQVRAIPAGS
jgi:hypothetical protein